MPMTPQFRLFLRSNNNHIKKNVGIHLLPVCWLRPTTALHADEQSDTHARIAETPR